MNSWKIIFATAVIFGAGVITGGLLVSHVERDHPRSNRRADARSSGNGTNQMRPPEMPRPRPPEMLSKEFVQQLDNALQLTPDQREAIEKIIASGQEQNRAIWSNNVALTRRVMQDAQRQIREQLTPAQQKQFPDLLKQFHPARRPAGTNAPPSNVKAERVADQIPAPAPTNAPGN